MNFVKINQFKSMPQAQRGASLLVTMVVLVALTVVALAVTNSNQSQSIMVRNNQFRLESFNVSYAEIDSQLYSINKRPISKGIPIYILELIDQLVGKSKKSTQAVPSSDDYPDGLYLHTTTSADYMEREIAHTYRGRCKIYGQQIGVGYEKLRCDDLKIESAADLKNTNIESDQHQVYNYLSLQ